MVMTYRFLEDIAVADVACEIEAATLDQIFAEAAEAFLKVQIENLEAVRPLQEQSFQLENAQVDLLLYHFLQELIYFKDAQKLLLLPDKIAVTSAPNGFLLNASLKGETLQPERHHQVVD